MNFSRIPTILLLILSVNTQVGAQSNEIFDKPIAKQPFDKEPFRQIKIPKWVEDTVGVGYTLSVQSSEQRKKAAAAGVTISEMGFVDPFYAYYDSKFLTRRSPHVPADRLAKDIAEYRKLGVKILGVYPPTLQSEVWEKHRDWRRVTKPNGEIPEIDLKKNPAGGMLCILGPYGDFLIDVLCEITTKFGVDAFSFDGIHYGGVCYCEHCRKAFEKENGKQIPPVNMEDPLFRRYQHWADRRMEDVVRRMQSRLKAIKPDVALVTWTTNAGRFGHFRDIPRNMPSRLNLLFDAPDQEFWLDETNRGNTIVPAIANAYIWATTNHRVAFSEPYLMSHGNPYSKDSFPPHEVLRRMLLSVTHGASPSLAVLQPEPLQEAAYEGLKEIQKRKPWLTHKKPEPWAAILLSDNTRVFYGRDPGRVEERYLANVFGMYRAALETHLQCNLINDWNLNEEDLSKYKLLILPNAACIDESQAKAIRKFVENGGGLIATGDTSLCDEFGTNRGDFLLADLFGCSWSAKTISSETKGELDENFARTLDNRYWQQRKNVFELKLEPQSIFGKSTEISRMMGRETVVFKGYCTAIDVKARDAHRDATILSRTGEKVVEVPGLITRQVGQGKVVYSAAALDAAYYTYSYPYQRLMLSRMIGWATNSLPPCIVHAPMCVQSSVMRQDRDGQRLLIHLFNDVNTTANHGLPVDDVPLREETIPIHDIKVEFRGYQIDRIHFEPGNIELATKSVVSGVTVTVPRLDIHGIVVVELKK